MRMIQIQDNISEQKNLKDKLESEQDRLHLDYNKVSPMSAGPLVDQSIMSSRNLRPVLLRNHSL